MDFHQRKILKCGLKKFSNRFTNQVTKILHFQPTYTSARAVKNNIEASNLEYGIKEGFAAKKHMIKGSVKTNKTKRIN